ncbi:hypothetical protein NKH77_07700 [Streptomyces sp. M19]
MVLEQPPDPVVPHRETGRERRAGQLLVLSARSTAALTQAGHELAGHLRGRPDADLGDLAATLAGRRAHRYRRAVAATTAEAAADALTAPGRRAPSRAPGGPPS